MAAVEGSIAVPKDDLDDLYNYDIDNTEDVFRDFEANMDAPVQPKPSIAPKTGADLGIDTEVQVVKKRKPIAKLDENRCLILLYNAWATKVKMLINPKNRLLSQAGIPKLRRIRVDQ